MNGASVEPIQLQHLLSPSGLAVLALPATITELTTDTAPFGPAGMGAIPHRTSPRPRRSLQVVDARLEQRDLALQELVAGEVAVVAGAGRRRRHLVLVDQVETRYWNASVDSLT
ncbi:MAG: hypothetical protein R2719_03615 [Micropruina sp.]